jgi:hypothetical protein
MSAQKTTLKSAGSTIMAHREFQQNAHKMKTNSSLAGNILTNLETQIQALATELRADEKGLKDYEQQLYLLEKEKSGLMRNIRKNKQFVDDFDKMIGPFSDKYTEMTKDMSTLYGNAKQHHANGVLLLIKEFDYHPAFKRRDNEFTAAPFKPK